MFYSFSIKVNKCSGSGNKINDPYAKKCVPDVVKSINVKIFRLMSFGIQRRPTEWRESLNVNVD